MYFYLDKLVPAPIISTRKQPHLSNFWPQPRSPILFCDIIGEEGQNKTFSKKQKKLFLSLNVIKGKHKKW